MYSYSFIDYINNEFNGQIPNLLFFGIGLAIGIILFFITFFIVYLISKRKPSEKKKNNDVSIINGDYKTIITSKKDIFNSIYKEKGLNEKVNGILKITLEMMEEISSLYYPASDEPIFEISIEQLVDFLSYFNKRIEFIIDNLIVDKLQIAEVIWKFEIKDAKLSKVIDLLNKNKDKKTVEEKKGIFSKFKDKLMGGVKKAALKFTGNYVDYSFNNIIDDLGEDINKLYSKQELIFTDISNKELKRIKRLEKQAKKEAKKHSKRNVGDSNV